MSNLNWIWMVWGIYFARISTTCLFHCIQTIVLNKLQLFLLLQLATRNTRAHIHTNTHTHTHTNTHTHTHKRARTHARTHTHNHTSTLCVDFNIKIVSAAMLVGFPRFSLQHHSLTFAIRLPLFLNGIYTYIYIYIYIYIFMLLGLSTTCLFHFVQTNPQIFNFFGCCNSRLTMIA